MDSVAHKSLRIFNNFFFLKSLIFLATLISMEGSAVVQCPQQVTQHHIFYY